MPALAECKTEEEKLAQVQKLSASGFAQAEEAANGLDGKLKQASNAWGGLRKVVGEALAPAVKAAAGLIKGICEIMVLRPSCNFSERPLRTLFESRWDMEGSRI